ncbi:hypothetical protein BVI434_2080003 [Burkholderia vietnamiensis]|nr:hypothetical protein BVI434_2080003 [Burkholderia vietnamiensis]
MRSGPPIDRRAGPSVCNHSRYTPRYPFV